MEQLIFLGLSEPKAATRVGFSPADFATWRLTHTLHTDYMRVNPASKDDKGLSPENLHTKISRFADLGKDFCKISENKRDWFAAVKRDMSGLTTGVGDTNYVSKAKTKQIFGDEGARKVFNTQGYSAALQYLDYVFESGQWVLHRTVVNNAHKHADAYLKWLASAPKLIAKMSKKDYSYLQTVDLAQRQSKMTAVTATFVQTVAEMVITPKTKTATSGSSFARVK